MKSKLLFKTLNIILVASLTVYVCFFGLKKARNYDIYSENIVETKIYTIWHVETFEGGSKSRINLLKNLAMNFEKNHKGILFMVTQIEPNELESKLSVEKPDIISFGYGLGKTIASELKTFSNMYNIRQNLLNSATFNNEIYALPYIASGYAHFSHGGLDEKIVAGSNEFINPNKAHNLDNIISSQYDAYKDFIYNKNHALIGSARDIYRVIHLMEIGRLSAKITPIETYTDLIQYVGKYTDDSFVNQYIGSLLSTETQTSLKEYGLFSTLGNKIYTDGIYSDMEDAIFNCMIPSLFNDQN